MRKIIVFDTTLRDGEQSPGCKMDVASKILVARQLEKLGVDVIEAGFPVASEGDFKAVFEIGRLISGATICALSRAKREDIETAARALEKSKKSPRIHIFIGTSGVHIKEKLRKTSEEILEMAVESVKLAKKYFDEIEFSSEDSSRTDEKFLAKIVKEVIEAGATVINIPDTVGYNVGTEYPRIIKRLKEKVPETKSVILSAHCHNDLGLAVANTLAAVEAGVQQVECCVLGIGERAGNAQLEAVIMALKTRADYYGVKVDINTKELGKTARIVSSVIGKPIPGNLPVVGTNAFAHAAGIHQHGVLRARRTYEIMKPEEVGWRGEFSPLTKHSGRYALKKRMEALGYQLKDGLLQGLYKKFVNLADNKKYIDNNDLHLLAQEILTKEKIESKRLITVKKVEYRRSKEGLSAEVILSQNGVDFKGGGNGNGPVASVWDAIVKAVSSQGFIPKNLRLKDFNVGKGKGGVEAVGLATILIASDGKLGYGRASETDIVLACAKAIVAAINHLLYAPVKQKIK